MDRHEIDFYNDLLYTLYNKSKTLNYSISPTIENERQLKEMLSDGLVHLYRREQGIGFSSESYGISTFGKNLIAFLPEEYSQNPYEYHLVISAEREERESLLKQKAETKLDYDIKMAKRAYNFFWVTFFTSIVSLIVSILSLLLKHK